MLTCTKEYQNLIDPCLCHHLITGPANGTYKLNDLNVQADATEDEEDEIDWEEG